MCTLNQGEAYEKHDSGKGSGERQQPRLMAGSAGTRYPLLHHQQWSLVDLLLEIPGRAAAAIIERHEASLRSA